MKLTVIYTKLGSTPASTVSLEISHLSIYPRDRVLVVRNADFSVVERIQLDRNIYAIQVEPSEDKKL